MKLGINLINTHFTFYKNLKGNKGQKNYIENESIMTYNEKSAKLTNIPYTYN